MATIVDGKKRIPFRRGMLMHYLIQRGFTHEEADDLANAAREALSERKDIPKKEIVRLLEQLIRKEYNSERRVGDLVFWERMPTSITVEHPNSTRPFSKELLSHSIQASGLVPDQAHQVAQTIESQLIGQHRSRITHQELADIAADELAEQYDKAYAERYRVWRAWGDLDRPLIILIGGTTGVGKTSLAISLANVLGIPRVVATDDIRQIMRLMLAPELMPSIHTSSFSAWSRVLAIEAQSMDPIIAGFREQAKVVSVGVRAILNRCIEENVSAIIDGVHLLPDFIDLEAYTDSVLLVPLCLVLKDSRAYKKRFAQRAAAAPSRPFQRYLSHLKEILKIQEHILASSIQWNIPVIDTDAVENVTSTAVGVVVEHLQKRMKAKKARHPKQQKKKKRRTVRRST